MNKPDLGCQLAGLALLAVLTIADGAFAQGPATRVDFTGTEVHVKWLAQPAPTILPSGITKIDGWEHLWYDDADDDRLDGYATVFIDATIDPTGLPIHAGGKFTLSEKLDDYELDDFLSGNFDPSLVQVGDILFEGTWRLTPSGTSGVARSPEGLLASYTIENSGDPNVNSLSGALLDPNRAARAVPEPSTFGLLASLLVCAGGWYRKLSAQRTAPAAHRWFLVT